jgi:serine/threonine protein kinase
LTYCSRSHFTLHWKGSTGTVVCADDQLNGTIVAIKIRIYYDPTCNNTEPAHRVQVPIILLLLWLTLNVHRYLIQLLGSVYHHSHNCLMLPLYGMTLGNVLQMQSLRCLPLLQVYEIRLQLVRGIGSVTHSNTLLTELHKHGFIHVDIKPDNIVLVDDHMLQISAMRQDSTFCIRVQTTTSNSLFCLSSKS